MDTPDKIKRFFQDDFIVGVETQSTSPAIYIDPNQYSDWVIRTANEKIEITKTNITINLNPTDKKILLQTISSQLDSQISGISSTLDDFSLLALLKRSITDGPSANNAVFENMGVCLINKPLSNMYDNDIILKTFELNDIYNPDHLKPIPGNPAIWKELIGEHEGEHCNQQKTLSTDKDVDIKHMTGETLSDRAAIKDLLERGEIEIVQAWIDIRALRANVDPIHATGIFLRDSEFTGATQEHLNATQKFVPEMVAAVSAELSLSNDDARIMMVRDPQKFVKTVKDAMDNDRFPAMRGMTDKEIGLAVAKEMGITHAQLQDISIDKIGEPIAAYLKLKNEDQLKLRSDEIPFVKDYTLAYIGAVERLFIADTTPKLNYNISEALSEYVSPTSEEDSAEIEKNLRDELLKEAAEFQTLDQIDDAMAKELSLDMSDIIDMRENETEKYIQTADKLFKDGKIDPVMNRPMTNNERDVLIAEALGIDKKDIPHILDKDVFIYNTVYSAFFNDDKFVVRELNPYIQKNWDKFVEEKSGKTPDTAPDTSMPLESNKPLESTVDIDMQSGDKASMKISGMKASEYFATIASPKDDANPAPTPLVQVAQQPKLASMDA